jgi:hypothetical protein
MRAAQTIKAFTNSVNFFRKLGIRLIILRMDNQLSEDLKDVALKRANRVERAIRTAKNHIVATRAGFHPDFSHAFLLNMAKSAKKLKLVELIELNKK